MSVKPLFNHLELRFWYTVIPLMQNSSPVRTILPWIYRFATEHQSKKVALTLLVCALSGGILGFLLGVLSQFL
jgi:hypothetical protein